MPNNECFDILPGPVFSFYLLETWSHLNFNLSSCAECSDCGREKAIQLTAGCVHLKFLAPNLTIKQAFVYTCTNCFFSSMLITLSPKCSEGQTFSLFHSSYATKKKQLVWLWFVAAQLSILTCSPFPFCLLTPLFFFSFFSSHSSSWVSLVRKDPLSTVVSKWWLTAPSFWCEEYKTKWLTLSSHSPEERKHY